MTFYLTIQFSNTTGFEAVQVFNLNKSSANMKVTVSGAFNEISQGTYLLGSSQSGSILLASESINNWPAEFQFNAEMLGAQPPATVNFKFEKCANGPQIPITVTGDVGHGKVLKAPPQASITGSSASAFILVTDPSCETKA